MQSINVERKYHKDAIKDSHNLHHFEYTNILEVIARAIFFHGKQGLALRGHRKTLQESDKN